MGWKTAIIQILLAVLLCCTASALELKTASQSGSEPKYIREDNGTVSGLEIDIMDAITEIDPGIIFVGRENMMPFKRIKSYLENGQIEVFSGIPTVRSRKSIALMSSRRST